MNLIITSASGNILSAEKFGKISLMTESGEITILSWHEPILSAIRPGIMSVEYYIGNKLHTAEYATGGGVLNIAPDTVTIVADVIQNADTLTDLAYIDSQKREAEELMKSYRAENGEIIDPKKLIEIEYELLKYTAMHRLGERYAMENRGARK
jgi:F0F1-type ATP synthase epsilon subunit